MAYMSQDHKKELAPGIKAVFSKYGIKGTLGVKHYSTLVANIKSGPINFLDFVYDEVKSRQQIREHRYLNINTYHLESMFFGVALDFLVELRSAMMTGNHDNSDAMTDYFDVGWYIDINIGTYEKDYIVT